MLNNEELNLYASENICILSNDGKWTGCGIQYVWVVWDLYCRKSNGIECFEDGGLEESMISKPVLKGTEYFLIRIARDGVHTGSTRHVGHFWLLVSEPGDCEDGEFAEMTIGRGHRSTRRKPAPAPLCPQQIPPDSGANPDRRGGKSATNRLSYDVAKRWSWWVCTLFRSEVGGVLSCTRKFVFGFH
jgi:hypothetical protein